jgi:putative transcriptional regulator
MNGKSIKEVVFEMARDMKFDKKTMRELESIDIPPLRQLSPEELREFRERENVSQAVMARYLNVTPSTIHKWERGEAAPQRAALRLLNLVFDKGLDIIAQPR